MTSKWPDGTPRSQGNVFDWRRPVSREWLLRQPEPVKTTEPRTMYYFQKARGK